MMEEVIDGGLAAEHCAELQPALPPEVADGPVAPPFF
jgi:hypothetical protein